MDVKKWRRLALSEIPEDVFQVEKAAARAFLQETVSNGEKVPPDNYAARVAPRINEALRAAGFDGYIARANEEGSEGPALSLWTLGRRPSGL